MAQAALALDVAALLRAVDGIECVVTGSVAAAAYGVPGEPNDFDIAPSTDVANLARLAGLLDTLGARPRFDPDWPEMTEADCEGWTPEPPSAQNLDHLYETPYGLFDVVPWRSGTYDELAPRAARSSFEGRRVMVAATCDLLPHLRLHKPKHEQRAPYLTDLCERTRRGEDIAPSFADLEAMR